MQRKPQFELKVGAFPQLGGRNWKPPVQTVELGEYLHAAAEDEAASERGEAEVSATDSTKWCWLPMSRGTSTDTDPPAPRHYARAARRILAAIQAQRDAEIALIGSHSRWWDEQDVRAPLDFSEEEDLRPWGWQEGDDFLYTANEDDQNLEETS